MLTTIFVPIVLWVGVWAAIAAVVARLPISRLWEPSVGLMVSLLALTALGSLLLGLWLRDRLLIRAVRRLINRRGTCAGCGYGLLGLPVPLDLNVTCPECGFLTQVDPSLGELVTESGGERRYRPSVQLPGRGWVSGRVVKRAALVVLVLGALGVGGYYGAQWYEQVRLDRQARRAASLRPAISAYAALYESNQRAQDGPNAWEAFARFCDSLEDAERKMAADPDSPRLADGSTPYPDYEWTLEPPTDVSPEDLASWRVSTDFARLVSQRLERDGHVALLDEVAAAPRALRPVQSGGSDGLIDLGVMDFSAVRKVQRLLASRFADALARDDQPAAASELTRLAGLVPLMDWQPLLIGQLMGLTGDARLFALMRLALDAEPSAEMLDTLEQIVVRRAKERPPFKTIIEGERLFGRDQVCLAFSDVERVRSGKVVLDPWSGPVTGRVGTLEENLAALDAHWDWVLAAFETPPGAEWPPQPASDLATMRSSLFNPKRFLTALRVRELDLRGLAIRIALERFRLREGRYPASLADAPDVSALSAATGLPTPMIDPLSGRPISYRLIDPASDTFGRGYLLYVWGADNQDDHGIAAKNDRVYPQDVLIGKGLPGRDFVLNRPGTIP